MSGGAVTGSKLRLSAAFLLLTSCAPSRPSSSPEELAAYDGQRTAYQLSLARDCGADRTKWDAQMKTAEAPGFSGPMLTAYSAAFERGMAIHRGRQPSEQECASV